MENWQYTSVSTFDKFEDFLKTIQSLGAQGWELVNFQVLYGTKEKVAILKRKQ